MYEKFGDVNGATHVYLRTARSILRDVAAEYSAYEFYSNRTQIRTKMQEELDAALRLYGAYCSGLNLLDFTLPPAFYTKIQRTIAATQNVEKAQYEQETAKIKAETDRQKARKDADIILQQKGAMAEQVYLDMDAKARAFQATKEAE